MKRFLLTFLLCGMFAAHAQTAKPQASPTQTLKQNFGTGSIELSYSRPGLKGRKLGGADFVPFGKVWRTGANGATTIQFSEDVTIGSTVVKAGKYGLLSIPDVKEWTLIITTDLTINNPSNYKQENDVVRVKVPVAKLTEKVETFTISFSDFTDTSCNIVLSWENTAVILPVSIKK